MKLREILREGAPTVHSVDFKNEVGVEWVNLKRSITYEEEKQLKMLGIDIDSLPSIEGKIPIIYPHRLVKKGNEAFMDAIKMRSDTDVVDKDALLKSIDKAIDVVVYRNPATIPGMMQTKRKGLDWFQRFLKQTGNVIIVPAPSSSPLTDMIATTLAQKTGNKVVHGLEKNHFPELSKKIKTVERGYEDRGPATSPADRYRAWMRDIHDMKEEMNRIDNLPDPSDADLERYMTLNDKIEQLEQTIKSTRFQKKNQTNPVDMARGFYDYLRPTDDAKQLQSKYVILVDDNVVTSETIAEAIKSLLRNGIIPKGIVGFTLHKYD